MDWDQQHAAHLLEDMVGGDADAAESLLPLVDAELDRSGNATRASREHFVAAAARVLRHILVEHAHIYKTENPATPNQKVEEVLTIDRALETLQHHHRGQVSIVELHYFGNLPLEHVASLLGIPPRTVRRDWALARIHLFRLLQG